MRTNDGSSSRAASLGTSPRVRAITKIRDKAIVNRAEALTHAQVLDELFDLRAHFDYR